MARMGRRIRSGHVSGPARGRLLAGPDRTPPSQGLRPRRPTSKSDVAGERRRVGVRRSLPPLPLRRLNCVAVFPLCLWAAVSPDAASLFLPMGVLQRLCAVSAMGMWHIRFRVLPLSLRVVNALLAAVLFLCQVWVSCDTSARPPHVRPWASSGIPVSSFIL